MQHPMHEIDISPMCMPGKDKRLRVRAYPSIDRKYYFMVSLSRKVNVFYLKKRRESSKQRILRTTRSDASIKEATIDQ